MALKEHQKNLFARNILLNGIGEEGQDKLLNSKVLIIGAGGLGSPAALYCAASGIGTIGIADEDFVELSNLQRQILHNMDDIGALKVLSAEKKLNALNPEINIVKHQVRINTGNAESVFCGYQFVIDATDNFASKFAINDACVKMNIPFSHAGVLAFAGQLMTVLPGKSSCYRCVFGNEPPKDTAPVTSRLGILGAIAGVIGSLQAAECIKYLCGIDTLLTNRIMIIDGKTMNCRTAEVKQNPLCTACGTLITCNQ